MAIFDSILSDIDKQNIKDTLANARKITYNVAETTEKIKDTKVEKKIEDYVKYDFYFKLATLIISVFTLIMLYSLANKKK